MKKPIIALSFALMTGLLNACQSLPKSPSSLITQNIDEKISFAITGKIGITTQNTNGKQAGSAFYGWTQENERFAIDLTGVLGIGATQIRYDGRTATLISDKGEITADSPEELLFKATGWHAPISQLPHWVMGKSATGDTNTSTNEGKLLQSTNGDWTATFEYPKNSSLPSRLIINHTDGHRVVMTIAHSS